MKLNRQCKRGHVQNEANTYVHPNGDKECRVCRRERDQERYRRRKREMAAYRGDPQPESLKTPVNAIDAHITELLRERAAAVIYASDRTMWEKTRKGFEDDIVRLDAELRALGVDPPKSSP